MWRPKRANKRNNRLWKKGNAAIYKKRKKNNIVNKNNLSLENMMMRKNIIVQDHCYYIGKYRGTAHNICNLR